MTLNIDDDLLRAVKSTAAARGMTLTSLVEEALRLSLTAAIDSSYRLDLPGTRGRRPPLVDIDSNAELTEYPRPRRARPVDAVTAVDTNVLIHANRSEPALHDIARERLVGLAESAEAWARPVVAVWGFVRIVTQALFDPPTPMRQALDMVDGLMASPAVRLLSPGPRHWELLSATIEANQVHGGMVTDAAFVALCREHGVDTVLSNDRDFDRFSSITWEPLEAS